MSERRERFGRNTGVESILIIFLWLQNLTITQTKMHTQIIETYFIQHVMLKQNYL